MNDWPEVRRCRHSVIKNQMRKALASVHESNILMKESEYPLHLMNEINKIEISLEAILDDLREMNPVDT